MVLATEVWVGLLCVCDNMSLYATHREKIRIMLLGIFARVKHMCKSKRCHKKRKRSGIFFQRECPLKKILTFLFLQCVSDKATFNALTFPVLHD